MNKFTSSDSHFAFADDVNLANRCPAAFADSQFMVAHVESEKIMICMSMMSFIYNDKTAINMLEVLFYNLFFL